MLKAEKYIYSTDFQLLVKKVADCPFEILIEQWPVLREEFFSLKIKLFGFALHFQDFRLLTSREVFDYFFGRSNQFAWSKPELAFRPTSLKDILGLLPHFPASEHNAPKVYFFDTSDDFCNQMRNQARLKYALSTPFRPIFSDEAAKNRQSMYSRSSRIVEEQSSQYSFSMEGNVSSAPNSQVNPRLSKASGRNSVEDSFKKLQMAQQQKRSLAPESSSGSAGDPSAKLFKKIHTNEQRQNFCPICYTDSNRIMARTNACDHEFCFECLWEWTKVTNLCPLCKQEFTQVFKYIGQVLLETRKVEPKQPEFVSEEDSHDRLIANADTFCYACRGEGDLNYLMICDHCNTKCCHTFCLQPPLDHVPQSDWYCDFCVDEFRLEHENPIAEIEIRRGRGRGQRRRRPQRETEVRRGTRLERGRLFVEDCISSDPGLSAEDYRSSDSFINNDNEDEEERSQRGRSFKNRQDTKARGNSNKATRLGEEVDDFRDLQETKFRLNKGPTGRRLEDVNPRMSTYRLSRRTQAYFNDQAGDSSQEAENLPNNQPDPIEEEVKGHTDSYLIKKKKQLLENQGEQRRRYELRKYEKNARVVDHEISISMRTRFKELTDQRKNTFKSRDQNKSRRDPSESSERELDFDTTHKDRRNRRLRR